MQIIGAIKNYPARVLGTWYLGMVILGTAMLMHPKCRGAYAEPISLLDAIFTSTSASCVTGLAVRSTGHDFSFLGQAAILLLIQVGGLGIMTITSYVIFTIGKSASLRDRAILSATMGTDEKVDLRMILRKTILVTVVAESIGFLILAVRNLVAGMPFALAIWHALFHSVSAFCNAGFALQDNSLVDYQGDVVVNAAIMSLVIVGGIGFHVILDLSQNWNGTWLSRWERLTLHTKLMLLGSAALLVFGMLAFLVFEWRTSLRELPYWQRPLVAMFHSVSCRTAGFNSVELSQLTNATLFVSILLMMIGAGPGSTAGGFKVSTLAILVLRAVASFRGRERVSVFRRTIPRETVSKAIGTAMLFAAVATIALTLLLAFEQSAIPHTESKGLFMDATFEVISALGTVGLSTGMTGSLTTMGRVIIIVLMFMGRLGPITSVAALSISEKRQTIEYSSEEPLIG